MSQFKKNLSFLPGVEGVLRLALFESNKPSPVWVIENKPGKAGSVVVYHFLATEYGDLTVEAAKAGLVLFAEHVESAREAPGVHPNVDLLFDVIERNRVLTIQVIKAES